MVTDTKRILRTDPGRPEVCNVCQLHRFFGDDYDEIWDGERTARTGCVDTKKLLADRIIAHYAPARERYAELMAHPADVDSGSSRPARTGCVRWPRRRWPRSASGWASAESAVAEPDERRAPRSTEVIRAEPAGLPSRYGEGLPLPRFGGRSRRCRSS